MGNGQSGSWWAVALRGIVALVVGIFLITNPGNTAQILLQVFGIFAIIDGILVGVMAVLGRKNIERSWVVFVRGLVGFALGLALLLAPDLSLAFTIVLVAVWSLVTGVIDLIMAWRTRNEFEGSWLLVAGGIIALLFGWMLLRNPEEVAQYILVLVGVFLVLGGIVTAVYGIHLKGVAAPGTGD
ncbi:MAG: HdeD family acid-resistance protein [Anaerolineae bacterium]|jgi:uncharacterized membrane protein HdeD (DUF308 family)